MQGVLGAFHELDTTVAVIKELKRKPLAQPQGALDDDH